MRSTHERDLRVRSIDLAQFGRMFAFEWRNSSEQPAGVIRANATTLLGALTIDSCALCGAYCYLGFQALSSGTHSAADSTPIVDVKSIDVASIDNLDELDNAFLNTLWLKSVMAKGGGDKPKPLAAGMSRAFSLDSKLLALLKSRFERVRGGGDGSFASRIRLVAQADSYDSDEGDDELATLSYSFDVQLKWAWPRFLAAHNHVVTMPLTQVHAETRTAELVVTNPSDHTVVMQIGFLNGYASRSRIAELVARHGDLIASDWWPDVRAPPPAVPVSSAFSVWASAGSAAAASSVMVTLAARETTVVQVRFRPDELGVHENVLIVRNNLTVLDACLLVAEADSAELRVQGRAPANTSLLFSAKVMSAFMSTRPIMLTYPNVLCTKANSAAAASALRLAADDDEAKLEMVMSEVDFALCSSHLSQPPSKSASSSSS